MALELDVLIVGGGGAGLWLLDELRRRGFNVLLAENRALGAGQTIASQGIIHGGIKYSLGGLISDSTRAIRDMPEVWRECLAGRREPNLSGTPVLCEQCYLWRTSSMKSKLGMVAARIGLHSQVTGLSAKERPPVLKECPGEVLQVNEQVIDPAGFLRNLSERNQPHLIKIDETGGITWHGRPARDEGVAVMSTRLRNAAASLDLEVTPNCVVLSAGAGNAALREGIGLSSSAMQRRPLHMVLARGDLPRLFGHCTDGASTRVTITSATDSQFRTVWQIGGKVAEEGVGMESSALIRHARDELRAVLPGCRFNNVEWSSYTIDRAEQRTPDGARPDHPYAVREGNVITAWPTKLALVPQLVNLIADALPAEPRSRTFAAPLELEWPRPEVALPPWEVDRAWYA